MFNINAEGEINIPFVRTPFNYDTNAASKAEGYVQVEPSKTQQQFKEECDINTIVRNFGITGQVPITSVQPMAGDFTNITDYQEALNQVIAAEDNFLRLPSSIRERFGHDPARFVDFCLDPKNLTEVQNLGLAPRPPAPSMADLPVPTPPAHSKPA